MDKFIGRTKSLSYKKNLFFDDRIDLNDLIPKSMIEAPDAPEEKPKKEEKGKK